MGRSSHWHWLTPRHVALPSSLGHSQLQSVPTLTLETQGGEKEKKPKNTEANAELETLPAQEDLELLRCRSHGMLEGKLAYCRERWWVTECTDLQIWRKSGFISSVAHEITCPPLSCFSKHMEHNYSNSIF